MNNFIFGVVVGFMFMFGVLLIIIGIIESFNPERPAESPDILRCRELGGMVIKSAWNGRLLDCKKL